MNGCLGEITVMYTKAVWTVMVLAESGINVFSTRKKNTSHTNFQIHVHFVTFIFCKSSSSDLELLSHQSDGVSTVKLCHAFWSNFPELSLQYTILHDSLQCAVLKSFYFCLDSGLYYKLLCDTLSMCYPQTWSKATM